MTREEIIKSMSLQDAIQVLKDTNCYGTMDIAKSVILKALEQEPKTETWSIKDVADTFKKHGLIREQEPKTGHWIPVSERLPEKEGRYLTTIFNEYDNELRYIMTCDYFSNGRWCPDAECASSNVIAWMPLPKPYKPQESEGKE